MGQLWTNSSKHREAPPQPLGFGRGPARPKIAPLLLLGQSTQETTPRPNSPGEADLDAVIVLASKPAKKADIDRGCQGAQADDCWRMREEAQPGGHPDADFQVFPSRGHSHRRTRRRGPHERDADRPRGRRQPAPHHRVPPRRRLPRVAHRRRLAHRQPAHAAGTRARSHLPVGCWPNSRRCPPKTNSNSSGKSAWPGSSSGSPDAPPLS